MGNLIQGFLVSISCRAARLLPDQQHRGLSERRYRLRQRRQCRGLYGCDRARLVICGDVLIAAGNGCVGSQTAEEHRQRRGLTISNGNGHIEGGCSMLGCNMAPSTGQLKTGGTRTRSRITAVFNRLPSWTRAAR